MGTRSLHSKRAKWFALCLSEHQIWLCLGCYRELGEHVRQCTVGQIYTDSNAGLLKESIGVLTDEVYRKIKGLEDAIGKLQREGPEADGCKSSAFSGNEDSEPRRDPGRKVYSMTLLR